VRAFCPLHDSSDKGSWTAQSGQRWKPEKNHRTEATEVTEDVQKIGNHWFCCRALGSLSPWCGGGMNAKHSGSQNEKYKGHPFAVGLKAA
jgi:hypothetical protein